MEGKCQLDYLRAAQPELSTILPERIAIIVTYLIFGPRLF